MGLFQQLTNYLEKKKIYKKLKRSFPTIHIEEGLVIKGPLTNMSLGTNVQMQSYVHIHLGGMEWCQDSGSLYIGDNSVISPFTVLYAAGPGGIRIGRNFDCGPGVKIFSSSTDYQTKDKINFGGVDIGDNVILYANVVVSPGVSIGDGAVVFPSSVVNSDIPKNAIYGGVPAKFIKSKV